jgi:hypothetical protein
LRGRFKTPAKFFEIDPGLRRDESARALRRAGSLELDGAAGFLDLLLDLFGFGLADAFLDRLGRAFDQRLGFARPRPVMRGPP